MMGKLFKDKSLVSSDSNILARVKLLVHSAKVPEKILDIIKRVL